MKTRRFARPAPLLLVALLVLACPLAQALTSRTTAMAPMRDGVRLKTVIFLPSSAPDGRWPAILIRTPYNADQPAAALIATLANLKGYALVGQDQRGRYGSEGEDYLVFQHDGWGEHRDGFDSVEWIAQQPWCNGQVATVGASAMGVVQNLMAPTQPPHLVCQHVGVAFASMYHESAFQGGAWRQALVEGWVKSNKFDPRTTATFHSHPDYDAFWAQFDPAAQAEKFTVPVMFVGGWYDIFNQGTIDTFQAVNTRGGPNARGKCRLVMEAFGHGTSKDLAFRNLKRPASTEELFWTNLWVKDAGKGLEKVPVVQYYVLGDPDDPSVPGNEWRNADAWPIPAKRTPFHLTADGRLDTAAPTATSASKSFRYDPKNPVPTIGGQNLMISKGPKDQRPIERRPDVLLFETPPLERPVEVTGRVTARLWVASSARDTDFTAKLTDVYPDGRSMLVLDGIRRMSKRNSDARRELLEPGRVYEVEIDLWSTSIVFNKSHKIRVAISSSNAPRFEPNPNTGRPSGEDAETAVATNTVYFDSERPSQLILPLPE